MNYGDHNRFIAQGMAGTRPFAGALHDFRQARQRAALEAIFGRLTGRSLALLPYEEIAEMLKARGRSERGVQDIPLTAVVGSVGRYNDFTRSFLPRHDWDAQRWASVKSAGHVADLPPIEVYQISQVYFVLDGNHRVSIARQMGLDYIQAHVVEVHTRVPLSPDVQPDDLIIKAEHAAFLEATRLDEMRPGCDFSVTVPGQYARLENHLEVHRFFMEMAEEQALPDAEAITRWYDEAYLPLVQAIREQGILHDFPERTETDLYVWLATHQVQLRNALGWHIRPNTAVAQFAAQVKPKRPLARVYRKVLDVVVPAGWKGRARASSKTEWAQERLLDRYSQSLFAEILVPLFQTADPALDQALPIAQRENGRIVGLFLGEADEAATRAWFDGRCAAADIPAVWVKETGSPADIICGRAVLADLVVLNSQAVAAEVVSHIWQTCTRPVLLLAGPPSDLACPLLAYDETGETALFVATYLAEQWRVPLVVQTGKTMTPNVHAYLEMHEVPATYVAGVGVRPTAVKYGCDLIIQGRNPRRRLSLSFERPLLVCP